MRSEHEGVTRRDLNRVALSYRCVVRGDDLATVHAFGAGDALYRLVLVDDVHSRCRVHYGGIGMQ